MCNVSNLFPLINLLGAMSVYLSGVFDLNFCCACWVRNPLDLFPSPWTVQVKKIKIPQDQEVTHLYSLFDCHAPSVYNYKSKDTIN